MKIKNRVGPARAQATRPARAYPSDLSDAQWRLLAAGLPQRVDAAAGAHVEHLLTRPGLGEDSLAELICR